MSNKAIAKDSKGKRQLPTRMGAVVALGMLCLSSNVHLSQNKSHRIAPRGVTAVSQVCELTTEQFPAIRGFRLGMTVAEVKRRFVTGFDEARADKYGMMMVQLTTPASITFPVAVNPSEFAGVFQLNFTFYEGRLIETRYKYTPAKWRDIREFLDVASPVLNIDVRQWAVTNTGSARLDCAGFAVQARLVAFSSHQDMPDITVTDTKAKADATKRKAEAIRQSEEERRRSFRP
jgi:hypothetical protein